MIKISTSGRLCLHPPTRAPSSGAAGGGLVLTPGACSFLAAGPGGSRTPGVELPAAVPLYPVRARRIWYRRKRYDPCWRTLRAWRCPRGRPAPGNGEEQFIQQAIDDELVEEPRAGLSEHGSAPAGAVWAPASFRRKRGHELLVTLIPAGRVEERLEAAARRLRRGMRPRRHAQRGEDFSHPHLTLEMMPLLRSDQPGRYRRPFSGAQPEVISCAPRPWSGPGPVVHRHHRDLLRHAAGQRPSTISPRRSQATKLQGICRPHARPSVRKQTRKTPGRRCTCVESAGRSPTGI